MRGEKLFRMVSVVQKKDHKKLIEFSKNYQNSSEEIISCIHFIISKNKQLLHQNITIEKLYFNTFKKDKDFNDIKLRDLFHKINKVIEDYIVFREIQSNKKLHKKILSQVFFNNRLFEDGLIETKNIIKQIENSKKLNKENDKILFESKIKQYLFEDTNYLKNKKVLVFEAIQHLDNYYFTEKLKWSHELLVESQYSNKENKIPYINEILSQVNSEPYIDNPFSQVYYYITLFYKNNYSIEQYIKLKEQVLVIIPFIEKQEKRSLIVDLNNYVQKLYKQSSDLKLVEEMHNINELGINHNVFIKKGKFNSHYAMNIVNIALRINKINWVNDFIISIQDIINDRDCLIIIKAMKEFKSRNFDEVLVLLNNVKFVDGYFAMNSKSFQAKSYFELKNFDLLNPFLTAMDLYYRRNKNLSQELIKSNLNFVLSLKKITNNINSKNKLERLYTKIVETKNVAYKIWLLNTIKSLIK